MGRVMVRNVNTYPYSEKFKNKMVTIEPGGFVWMEELEAIQFMGTMNRPVLDSGKQHKPEGFKMLRLERGEAPEPATTVQPTARFVCAADGKEFKTQQELDMWIKAHHSKSWVDQERANEAMKEAQEKAIDNIVNT